MLPILDMLTITACVLYLGAQLVGALTNGR